MLSYTFITCMVLVNFSEGGTRGNVKVYDEKNIDNDVYNLQRTVKERNIIIEFEKEIVPRIELSTNFVRNFDTPNEPDVPTKLLNLTLLKKPSKFEELIVKVPIRDISGKTQRFVIEFKIS